MRRCAMVLIAACAVGGCGGGGSPKTVTVARPAAPAPSSTTPNGSAASPTPSSSPALVTGQADINGNSLTLRMTQLKRSGSLVTLNFTLTNDRSTTTDGRLQIGGNFDDGIAQKTPDSAISQLTTLDGIYLIDQAHQRKYPVARDSQGVCVCSGDGNSVFVDQQATVGFTATFGAPSADVRALDVSIPHFKTFTGVPLS